MTNVMAVRANNRLFNLLMFLVSFTFLLVWLPLLRCLFDGSTYSWGQSYFGLSFSSVGLSAHYLVLILFFLLYLALFYSSYWVKNRRIFYALLIWWWLHVFGNLLLDLFVNGDVMFHGDTLNVHVSLRSIVLVLSVIAVLLIIWVVWKDRRMEAVAIPWSRSNRLKAWILLAPLALQGILLATGEPHGTTDQIGVIIAITQALLFPIIFWPARSSN